MAMATSTARAQLVGRRCSAHCSKIASSVDEYGTILLAYGVLSVKTPLVGALGV